MFHRKNIAALRYSFDWKIPVGMLGVTATGLGLILCYWIAYIGVKIPVWRGTPISQEPLLLAGAMLLCMGLIVLIPMVPVTVCQWVRYCRFSLRGLIVISLITGFLMWLNFTGRGCITHHRELSTMFGPVLYRWNNQYGWWSQAWTVVDEIGYVACNSINVIFLLGAISRWNSKHWVACALTILACVGTLWGVCNSSTALAIALLSGPTLFCLGLLELCATSDPVFPRAVALDERKRTGGAIL